MLRYFPRQPTSFNSGYDERRIKTAVHLRVVILSIDDPSQIARPRSTLSKRMLKLTKTREHSRRLCLNIVYLVFYQAERHM